MADHTLALHPAFFQRMQQAMLLRLLRLARLTDQDSVRYARLAWLGTAALLIYCVVWASWLPQQYDNLPLRILGTSLCLAMVVASQLRSHQVQRLCMFLGATCVLPFFFTFMFLMNRGTGPWSQLLLLALVVLFSFETRWALRVFACGTVLASAAVLLSASPGVLLEPALLEQLPLLLLAIVLVSGASIGRRALARHKLTRVSQGVGSVSHELRMPLVSIDANVRGMQRLLRQVTAAGDDEAMLDALARVEAEVAHMKQMIDLFALSSSALRTPLGPNAQVAMRVAVDSVIARYPFTSEAERAVVAVEERTDFVFAGQHELCVVVLLNLLRNALAAVQRAGKGRIRIVIDGRPSGPRLLFIDTACGIAPAVLPLIFERFYSYPPGDGSGIGLSLCRQILTAWKARIRCVSREHAYTMFVLEFPADAHLGKHARAHAR